MLIRHATCEDGVGCAAVYTPYVTDTTITFEYEPPSAHEMAARIEAANARHAWLVAEDGSGVFGYAYGAEWMAREAYRWTCVVSVYVEVGRRRTGAGRALYEALFTTLSDRGQVMAVAGLTLPNEASAGLHRALGFEPVGTYRAVGWKHGAWHDVEWLQRRL